MSSGAVLVDATRCSSMAASGPSTVAVPRRLKRSQQSATVDSEPAVSSGAVLVDATGCSSTAASGPSTVAVPRRLKRSQPSVEDQLIQLQKQTLAGVEQLVGIQQQLLEVEKAKLELKREMVAMKKAKMAKNGIVQADDGSWMIVVQSTEE